MDVLQKIGLDDAHEPQLTEIALQRSGDITIASLPAIRVGRLAQPIVEIIIARVVVYKKRLTATFFVIVRTPRIWNPYLNWAKRLYPQAMSVSSHVLRNTHQTSLH